MASSWVKFRDKVRDAFKRAGKNEVKRAVSKKLVSQGYDEQDAAQAAHSLVNKAEAEIYYDENGMPTMDVKGRRLQRSSNPFANMSSGGSDLMPILVIGGLGLAAFTLLRKK